MIQIDAEIPSNCFNCKFEGLVKECPCYLGYASAGDYRTKRHKDCPLKEVPSGKWIPVTEKLPEPMTFVNATCRSLVDDRENWVVETIYVPIPKEHNPKGYSDWGNIPMLNWGQAEVIAWVERIIPEPYKEQTGENNDK